MRLPHAGARVIKPPSLHRYRTRARTPGHNMPLIGEVKQHQSSANNDRTHGVPGSQGTKG